MAKFLKLDQRSEIGIKTIQKKKTEELQGITKENFLNENNHKTDLKYWPSGLGKKKTFHSISSNLKIS